MLRLLLGGLISRRAQTVTLFALAMLSVAAGTAAPLYAGAADEAVVAAKLRAATPAERAITFTADVSAVGGYSASLQNLRGEVASALGSNTLTEVAGVRVPGSAGPVGQSQTAAPVVARDEVCSHLFLLEGDCPAAAGEVALSDPTARQLGVRSGSQLEFRAAESGKQTMLRVTGVYDPAAGQSDKDPYWAGRVDLTPQPLRDTNPMFVVAETIDMLGADKVVAMVDLCAGEAALTSDTVAEVAEALEAELTVPGVAVSNGLPKLLHRIQATQEAIGLAAPLGAVQLLFVCWFVLVMVVTYTPAARRTELAIGTLRGAPARHRVLLAHGPTALVLLLAAPFGVALGWLIVRALTWGTPAGSAAVALDRTALLASGGTLLVVMASTAIAEHRAHSGSLIDALRQVPARRGRRVGLVEVAAIVIAMAAVGQSYASPDQSGGLALMVPLLLALVAGLLTARLVRPAANVYGAGQLHRGRLATGHAALQVARRPGADRLVALTVLAVALVGYTVSAWNVAGSAAWQRAELELGAPRVVTVYAASSSALLTAVHKADPDGDWAMAASRGAGEPSIGVESARLAAVSIWPEQAALSPQQAAKAMRPQVADPVIVNGSELELGVTVVRALETPLHVTAVLTGPAGELVTGAVDIAEKAGSASYRMALPTCATAPGCRLAWLSFPRSPHDVQLNALTQQGPQHTLLAGKAIGAASRWRPALGSEHEVTLLPASAGTSLSLRYEPADPLDVSTDIRLYVNDGPLPLPTVAACTELTTDDPQQSRSCPADVRRVSPVLPGVAADGLLFDLEYASRVNDGGDNAEALQVWLGDEAPADAVDRLRAAGLEPVHDETVASRVARYQQEGAGLALRLHLAAAVLSVLLVGLALLVVAATDRRSRAAELAALRIQGLPAADAARTAHLGNLAMIAIAAPVGALTAALSWGLSGSARAVLASGDDSLPLPDPSRGIVALAVVAATAVLLLAAVAAGRSLTRATARGDKNAAGVRR